MAESFLLLTRFQQRNHFLNARGPRFGLFGAFNPFDIGVSVERCQ
jgi:hypothetical protein